MNIKDIDLKLAHEQEIDFKLNALGIIDITALSNKSIIDNLNLKLARYDQNKNEIFSLILLDKDGNGKHNDFNVDLIALAPNNWTVLNGTRFMRLNFYPLKKKHAIFIYDHFERIVEINDKAVITAVTDPTDDFIAFPYTLPSIVRNTIFDKELDFKELGQHNKLILIEFWGTWCKPCVKQIPVIKRLHENYSKHIIIVGISANDKKEKLKEVVTRLDMGWPQIQMDDELSKNFGEVNVFPLGILYDQNGRLINYGIKPKDIIKVLDKYD